MVPSLDAAAVADFVESIASEPRFFGQRTNVPMRSMSTSRLLHPIAGPSFVAIVDSTIVGLAHVELPRRDRGAEFSIQVRSPWRRAGLGAKLLRSLTFSEDLVDLGSASCLVARNNRAALALAASVGLERHELEVSLIELRLVFGQSARRCA